MGGAGHKPKRVCFLGAHSETVDEVSGRLKARDVEMLVFQDIAALTSGMGPASDAVLVLDTRVLPQSQDAVPLLARIEQGLGERRPDLVFIARSNDIDQRLQALRAGAEAFFASPFSLDELVARLLEFSGAPGGDRYRVLVVDDQPVAALFAARVLEKAGMETRVVGDALKVLDVLEDFRPDLVLMDLHMPGANGIELTTLIREHDELYGTPVVFLSSELDTGKQMDALRVGGDDFIAKPVRPEQLIETVRKGIRSSRSMTGLNAARPERDWITGLLRRPAFLRRLDALIARGSDQESGRGVLMIELDARGSEIEPERTHLVMERLAGVLREQMGPSDLASRYGDHRFAVLAMREDEMGLRDLAQTLRDKLAAVATPVEFRIGIGIGLFRPQADDALTMMSRAESACFRAQDEGAGGIGTYRPRVPPGTDLQRETHLIEMVEEALRSDGFRLMHQPIMALRQLPGERYETTLRLKAQDGEYIRAFDFLPAAKRRGLMPSIDRWVMGHALDELKRERNAHGRLRFFVHQTMETLGFEDWLLWFRDQIVEHDLIMQRPVLQFQLPDLAANREVAATRIRELQRLSIKTCLNLSGDGHEGLDLIEALGIELVRFPLNPVDSIDAGQLTALVARVHQLGSEVIVARIEQPQAIGRAWSCGADFIQGNFLQLPAEELSFDFVESALT